MPVTRTAVAWGTIAVGGERMAALHAAWACREIEGKQDNGDHYGNQEPDKA